MRIFCRLILTTCLLFVLTDACSVPASAEEKKDQAALDQARMELYLQMEQLYGIPWYYVAAIDQYERTMTRKKKGEKKAVNSGRITSIIIPPEKWSGFFNPEDDDYDESTILFFEGMGKDGSGDQKADQTNDLDVLTTISRYLADYGFAREDFRIGLWNYYKKDLAVRTIDQFSRIYEKYGRLDLRQHSFPIPARYEFSYNNTWGDARGWGGRRSHEGTDIFADYGTPVLSTGYGVVEVVGWNRYGGWRIGMRDMDNVYHYLAHLSAFRKGLKAGDIVEPGQVLGYVGSSGYGKPGTSGKFPPHLHYGMYRDMGQDEWAFDPYPYLKIWERQMATSVKKRR